MNHFNQYNSILQTALNQVGFPEQPHNLYDPLRYFMQLGGKRMRPILSLMACKLFDKDFEKALNVALCVEYFHNFSLIHDDIMDAAPLRRGQTTVHKKWNENIAILSGDVMLVKAYDFLANYPPQIFQELFLLFNKTAKEVCEGQQMDMDFESRNDVNETEYLEMIRLKTSVLLGCALQMGAIVGKADKENACLLFDFGEYLGMAFQIHDDILDLYGQTASVGKQIGGDILANKKTLLSLSAMHLANNDQRNTLRSIAKIEDPQLKIEKAKRIYRDLGALSYCQQKMNQYQQKALSALEKMSCGASKNDLIALTEHLSTRAN